MQTSGVPFTRLGRYELIAPIGEGGMALVYAGRSVEEPARPVALKVIRAAYAHNQEFIAMFLDEARIASRLAHPNVVELLEFGHENARYFLALELVFGQTLVRVGEASRERGVTIPHEIVAWMGARVADALHYAHELTDEAGHAQEVVHRDVNPSNILISYDGQPKVIDFGLAHAEDRIGSTRAGIVKGKLAYLAPEQARGERVDRRVDVFGLGVTLWELSLGRRLFKSDEDLETLQRVLTSEVPDPRSLVPGYPPDLAGVILRAATRDADKRYATAAELARDLDACARGADAKSVAELMGALFPTETRAKWEGAVADATGGNGARASAADDRVLVWDDDARKMTWMQVEGTEVPKEDAPTESEWIAMRLREQAAAEGDSDTYARARASLELAVRDELLGDGSQAKERALAALALEPTLTAAHAILRRVLHSRKEPRTVLPHLDAEIASAATARVRADLAAERARIQTAAGEPADVLCAAWDSVLAIAPEHPAALKGRERVCRAMAKAGDEKGNASARRWADHLARMADAFAGETKLAAWLHVERARALDAISEGDAAADAYAQALAKDPGLGPVRDACVMRASARKDAATLATLFAEEAQIEPDAARAARLELDAACLVLQSLADPERATGLLRRARDRAPTAPSVDRRVQDELVRLHEAAGRLGEAREVRRARLGDSGDARTRAFELRCIAGLAEREGKLEDALADIELARAADPNDDALVEHADRLLKDDPARREALWVGEAERRADPHARAAAWREAARIAEAAGRPSDAAGHLRAAVAALPEDSDLADRLAASSAAVGGPDALERVRERVAVYTRAAERTEDVPRKVAYLEKIALLWEELAGDAGRAAHAYEEILALEPKRVGAVMGLARTAARAGDGAMRARALLDEAALVADGVAADEIRVRAAEVLADADGERAKSLLGEVLERRAGHDGARALLVRLLEQEGRWGDVDKTMAARITHTKAKRARALLLAARADVQKNRLGAPAEAAALLRHARSLDPEHPALVDAILECIGGDPRARKEELAALAESAATGADKARLWTRAAEIEEMVLLDDEGAEKDYQHALRAVPDDAWIKERLARVRLRRGKDLGDDGKSTRELLARAAVFVERGKGAKARPLVDEIIATEPHHVAALRVLEEIACATGSAPLFANALEQQIAAFSQPLPKLAALWAEAALVEWELPETSEVDVYPRILALRPDDRAALDGGLRHALALRRAGDASSGGAIAQALAGLLELASEASSRFALHLGLALVTDGAPANARVALGHYRAALALHHESPSAAAGVSRLGAALGDNEARIAGACALADLAKGGSPRAAFLVQAAGLLLSGKNAERRARASDLLERALDASPESAAAVGLLTTILKEDGQRDRLIAVLRKALGRATGQGAIVTLGRELARIAREAPTDWGLVVDALLRVREAAPGDGATLMALAEAYAAQRAFPEAAATLETVVANARDAGARKKAMFQLVEIYERLPGHEADAERVLGAARELDPRDPRAARGLLALLRRKGTSEARAEAAALLGTLMELEQDAQPRAALAVELAQARVELGDRPGAERAFVEALAQTPNDEMVAAAASFAPAPRDRARLLAVAGTRSTELGHPSARLWLELAALEIDALGQLPEGIAHLRAAVALDPQAHHGRALLARGLARSGKSAEGAAAVLAMIDPDATPILSLADPSRVLVVLEDCLTAERRPQEALVARELRAVAGGLDEAAVVALRKRRLPPWYEDDGGPPPLDGATLRDRVFPSDARHVLLDVAAAIAGTEARVLPDELSDLGLTPRDRVGADHPLWTPFERARRALGLTGVELAICEGLAQPRLLSRAPPWVVIGKALAAKPEPVQMAALARLLTRIALGATWIDRLPAPQVRGLLVAAARLVVPSFGNDIVDGDRGDAANDYARPLGRAITRAQKKALSLLADDLDAMSGPTIAHIEAFVRAVRRAELRVAFLLTGDMLAVTDEAQALPPASGAAALTTVLTHPLAADAFRFALTPRATTLRRELGTLWS